MIKMSAAKVCTRCLRSQSLLLNFQRSLHNATKSCLTEEPKCPYSSVSEAKVIPTLSDNSEDPDLCPSVAVSEWKSAKNFEDIPAPPTVPVIGHMWKVLPLIGDMNTKRVHWHHEKLRRKYGPITRLNFPQKDVVFLYNPEDTEKMYRAAGIHPNRSGLFRALLHYRKHTKKDLFSTVGLILSQGDEWYRLRSKVQQTMMRPQSTKQYMGHLEVIVNDFMRNLHHIRDKDGTVPPTFINELYKWALESVAFVALNTRLGCLKPNLPPDSEPQQMIEAVASTFQAMNKTEMGVPLWRFFSTPAWKQLVKAQDYFYNVSVKYIQQTLKQMGEDSDDDNTSLLEQFLKKGLPANDAAIVAVDLLIAGIDTTSHATAFTLYQLAKHPEAQDKLYKELKSVVPNNKKHITQAHLNKMPYLKCVLKEGLRMHWPFYATFRVLEKDTVMSGYRIPRGTFVASMGQTICRQPEYYTNPNQFYPERWLKKETKPHPFTFIPFGHGPRMCIGRRFAEVEIQLLLAKICQRYEVEYKNKDLDMFTLLISYPDQPLTFTFKERNT